MITILRCQFITIIAILISIAFLTLVERKLLGFAQARKGPNKVRYGGILQPIADAMKLFTKKILIPRSSNYIIFNLAPTGFLFLSLTLWILIPIRAILIIIKYGIIFFFCVSRLNIYAIIGTRWRSNSKYSLLGALRSLAQIISYEVTIALIIISILFFVKRFNFQLSYKRINFIEIFIIIIIFFFWIICLLAELNRAPFDLTEGERELVSGFNTEYGGGLFAFIFIAEYINIIFLRTLTRVFIITSLYGVFYLSAVFISIKTIGVRLLIILIRASFPRIRYDILIVFNWQVILPILLILLVYIFSIAL